MTSCRPATSATKGVTTWLAFVGGGEPRYILNFAIRAAQPGLRVPAGQHHRRYPVVDEMIGRVERFCRDRFPDVVAIVQPSDMGPPVEKPIQVRLSGSDADQLFVLVDEVKDEAALDPGHHEHRRRLGPADQEDPGRDQPAPGAARRRDQPGHRGLAAVDPQRHRVDRVPGRQRPDPGHAALGGGGPPGPGQAGDASTSTRRPPGERCRSARSPRPASSGSRPRSCAATGSRPSPSTPTSCRD